MREHDALETYCPFPNDSPLGRVNCSGSKCQMWEADELPSAFTSYPDLDKHTKDCPFVTQKLESVFPYTLWEFWLVTVASRTYHYRGDCECGFTGNCGLKK